MLNSKNIDIGIEVEALCTKCKNATAHVITRINEGEISRVMCKTCLSTHRFRAVDDKVRRKLAKLKKLKTTKKSTESRESRKWNKILEQADPAKAISYHMDASYTEHDIIQHAKFGLGVVVKILDPGKMAVMFSDGIRNMVQNLKSPR